VLTISCPKVSVASLQHRSATMSNSNIIQHLIHPAGGPSLPRRHIPGFSCDRSALLLPLRFHRHAQAWKEHIFRLQRGSGMRTSFTPHKCGENTFSRGTCNRSVHRRTIRGCLAIRGYASAAVVALVRQRFLALRARFVEEVSPVFHHRLNSKMVLASGTTHRAAEIGKSWLWPLNITEAETRLGEPAATAFCRLQSK
jgi:hypothetical protein